MMADSRSSLSASPLFRQSSSVSGRSRQLSLRAITWPLESRNSRMGSLNGFVMPAWARDGPTARTATFLSAVPVIIKPPIITFSPVSTRTRVEIFSGFGAATLGLAVADGIADALGPALALGLTVGDGDTVVPGVALGDGFGVEPASGPVPPTALPSSEFK